MVEGSLWVHGRTDLADLYRDRLSLRQVWVRYRALPAEAPIWAVLRDEYEKAENEKREAEVAALLAQFQPAKG